MDSVDSMDSVDMQKAINYIRWINLLWKFYVILCRHKIDLPKHWKTKQNIRFSDFFCCCWFISCFDFETKLNWFMFAWIQLTQIVIDLTATMDKIEILLVGCLWGGRSRVHSFIHSHICIQLSSYWTTIQR